MTRYLRMGIGLAGSAMFIGLISAPLMASDPVAADSEQVTKLLREVRTLAFQLKDDAAEMETFNRSKVSVTAHAEVINQIRQHVNALAAAEDKLEAAKNTAAPWQKTAIYRIDPFIDELTGYTNAAIEYINGTVKHTPVEYADYLEANADYSGDLATMIAQFIDYGRAKQRMDRVAGKLEVPPGN